MADTVRVGVIGCGKIARVSHVPRYMAVPGAEVAALCDIDAGKMDAMQTEHGLADVACFTDCEALLKSDLDAVSICTPNSLHYPMTLAAFEAGLHVLCEKPMAATLPEATEMIAAGRRAGKVLQINQSLRYHPQYAALAKLVAAGEIGDVLHVRCIRAGGSTPNKSWSPGADWFVSKAFQGGLVLDIGIHMADLLKWIGGDVAQIGGLVDTRSDGIDVPDNVSALFRFCSGATGVLEMSWTLPTGAALLEVYGTAGCVRMGFGEQPLELTKITDGKSVATCPEPLTGVRDSFESFIDAIHGVAPSPTPGELGRDALALCDAIVRSSAAGAFVDVARF